MLGESDDDQPLRPPLGPLSIFPIPIFSQPSAISPSPASLHCYSVVRTNRHLPPCSSSRLRGVSPHRSSPQPHHGTTVHSTALGASDCQSNRGPDPTLLAVRLSVKLLGLPDAMLRHFLRIARSNDLICQMNCKKAGISHAFERLEFEVGFCWGLGRVMRCNAYLICKVTYLSIILFGRAAGDETC